MAGKSLSLSKQARRRPVHSRGMFEVSVPNRERPAEIRSRPKLPMTLPLRPVNWVSAASLSVAFHYSWLAAWGHPEARLLPLAVPVVEGLRCDSCGEADHSGTFAIRLAHLGYGWPPAGRRCGEVSFSSVDPPRGRVKPSGNSAKEALENPPASEHPPLRPLGMLRANQWSRAVFQGFPNRGGLQWQCLAADGRISNLIAIYYNSIYAPAQVNGLVLIL